MPLVSAASSRYDPAMSAVAVALVLLSAVFHATWNTLTKRSADALAFMFVFGLIGLAIYAPAMALMLARHGLPADGVPFILASGGVHVVYASALAAAYRNGALSLTYPVARGTGVVLVPILAMPFLGERPTAVAGAGIVAILVGIVTLNLLGNRRGAAREVREGRRGLLFALLTGLAITAYSLIDKAGVAHVHPLIYVYLLIGILTAGIAPWVLLRRRAAALEVWRTSRRSAFIAGVLNMGTYLIVLAAMRVAGSSVSYIVPLRETSIVFATLMGVAILGERLTPPRLAGSILIAAGVIAIALGG